MSLLPEGEEMCAVVGLGKYLVRTAWTQVPRQDCLLRDTVI